MGDTYHHLITRPNPQLLSVVIPVYNEQEVIPLLEARMTELLPQLPCATEVLLVNDGSADRTLELLLRWAEHDSRVRVLGLARNFGHQIALTAGMDAAVGQAVVTMDADLQDPPQVMLDMLREYRRGYDVVYGRRVSRAGETLFKRGSAWLFYRFMRLFVHRDLPPDTGDFRLVSRACLDALKQMRETHRFLRGMVAWVGFPQIAVPFERHARAAGRTKYALPKMIQFALTASLSFSPLPLRISLVVGMLVALGGLAAGAYAVAAHALGFTVVGWTSQMVLICLVGAAILISNGILGEYVGRIFEETKDRPLYVVSLQVNALPHPPPATSRPMESTPNPPRSTARSGHTSTSPPRP